MLCKVECDAYRLGDVYTGYFERHFDITRVCSFWPSSLACDLASGRLPRQLFCRSLARADTDPGTVYVHLRLGDVLDWDVYRPRVGTYVIPARHYNRTRLPPGVRRAAIVGNPWYRTRMTGHGRSEAYASEVAAALRARGLAVSMPARSEKNASAAADDDFRTLVFATHAILGRGSFAALATRCRRELSIRSSTPAESRSAPSAQKIY